MSSKFNGEALEGAHVAKLFAGIESLAKQVERKGRITNISGNEAYAASVLTCYDLSLKNIDGSEGFIKDALYKTKAALSWIDARYYCYVMIVDRFIQSKLSTAVYKIIYRERSAEALAKNSPYTLDQIVGVIKNPDAEENKIKKLEEMANKGVDDNHGFKVEESALSRVVTLTRQQTDAKELVTSAISEAGSVEKLLKKHSDVTKNITIDTNAYKNIYDALSKEKNNAIDQIVDKLNSAEEELKRGESELGADLFLSTHPSDLKATFTSNKDFANDINIVSKIRLSQIINAVRKDIDKLEKMVSQSPNVEDNTISKFRVAGDLLKVYTGVMDIVMEYEHKVNKATIYAQSVCAEAQYKMIIAAAKAEMK